MIWFWAWVVMFLDFDCNVLEPKLFWTWSWSWIILSLNLNTFALETMIQLCSALAPFVSSLSLNYVVLQLHLFWAWAWIISVPFLRHSLVQPSFETRFNAEVEFCPEPLIRYMKDARVIALLIAYTSLIYTTCVLNAEYPAFWMIATPPEFPVW